MEKIDACPAQSTGDRKVIIGFTLAVAIGALFGYLVYQQLSTPFVRERVRQPVVVDLVDMARENRLQLQAPQGANAAEYIQTKAFTIGGDTRAVIFMHPTSSAAFHMRLPDELRLDFALGLDPEVWDKAGDGVQFQVEVRDQGKATTVFSQYLDPKKNPSDRRWVDASVDLSYFAYREVDLVLRTFPGASNEFDWAGWATPRLVYATP